MTVDEVRDLAGRMLGPVLGEKNVVRKYDERSEAEALNEAVRTLASQPEFTV